MLSKQHHVQNGHVSILPTLSDVVSNGISLLHTDWSGLIPYNLTLNVKLVYHRYLYTLIIWLFLNRWCDGSKPNESGTNLWCLKIWTWSTIKFKIFDPWTFPRFLIHNMNIHKSINRGLMHWILGPKWMKRIPGSYISNTAISNWNLS